MPAPKADPPKCDTPGCGSLAEKMTDGTEVDRFGRPAIKNINVCGHHENWPHSEDAQAFAATDVYKRRK